MSPVSNTDRPEDSLITPSLWRPHHRVSPCTVAMNASIAGVYDVHVYRDKREEVDLDLLTNWGNINAVVNFIGASNRAIVCATTESNHGTIQLAVTSRQSPISISVITRHGGIKILLPRDFDGVVDVVKSESTVPPTFEGELAGTIVQVPRKGKSRRCCFVYGIQPPISLTDRRRPFFKRDQLRIRTLTGKVSIGYAYTGRDCLWTHSEK